MSGKNNCLRLYYDWLRHLSRLSDAEFRAVIVAAADFSRDGTQPPEMEGAAAMALDFMLSDMRRYAAQVECGSLGGKKRAENERKRADPSPTLEGGYKGSTRGVKHIDIDKDKDKDIDIDNNIDRDEDIDITGASAPSSSVSEREILNLFRELCPSLVQPKGLTQAIRAEIAGCPAKSREELAELFRRAETLPLCRGESGRKKKFSLGGVLRNAEQILCGAFDPYEEAKKEKPDSAAFGAADVEYWESIARARGAEEA